MKWYVALRQYDIHYQPRKATKAQILADFLAEFTTLEGQLSTDSMLDWHLFMDGFLNSRGKGTKVGVKMQIGELIGV